MQFEQSWITYLTSDYLVAGLLYSADNEKQN